MISPPFGIVGVLALLVVFMAMLSFSARHFGLHPEWTRKILHIGMGIVSLCFPIVFKQTWPVFVLAAFAIFWLWGARRISILQRIFGSVLTDVRRQSWGEMYFAFSVAVLFWLSGETKILFLIPVAILTFADAFAALVGVRWGKHRLWNLEKTREGSLAFFAVAFCIAIIVLVQSDFSWLNAFFVAMIIAFFLTIAEAFSRDGFDNFFVPLTAFLLLKIWV